MATHSSILAWEIPWTEEPGGLQFMESLRVGHNLEIEHAHTPYNCFCFYHCCWSEHLRYSTCLFTFLLLTLSPEHNERKYFINVN